MGSGGREFHVAHDIWDIRYPSLMTGNDWTRKAVSQMLLTRGHTQLARKNGSQARIPMMGESQRTWLSLPQVSLMLAGVLEIK